MLDHQVLHLHGLLTKTSIILRNSHAFSERKKVVAFQEVAEESLSEIAAPESLNVKKPSLLSMSCTGYCKESVKWKKHCSVHICLGGHSGRGRRKGRRNKSADDLRKVKAELVNFCPLK